MDPHSFAPKWRYSLAFLLVFLGLQAVATAQFIIQPERFDLVLPEGSTTATLSLEISNPMEFDQVPLRGHLADECDRGGGKPHPAPPRGRGALHRDDARGLRAGVAPGAHPRNQRCRRSSDRSLRCRGSHHLESPLPAIDDPTGGTTLLATNEVTLDGSALLGPNNGLEIRSADNVIDGLKDAFITSWEISSGGERPTESVTIAFSAIRYTYTPFDEQGRPGAAVTTAWNIVTGKPEFRTKSESEAQPVVAGDKPASTGTEITVEE